MDDRKFPPSAREVIFHLKGSEKTKDESFKASASFILKKGPESHLFILKEAEPKDKSFKASASFIMRKVVFHFKKRKV